MLRLTALATALLLAALPARAAAATDQLLALVSAELPGYAPSVDAATLSRGQLAMIYSIMHSDKSGGDKNALIRSTLGGGYSLRSLIFNRRSGDFSRKR